MTKNNRFSSLSVARNVSDPQGMEDYVTSLEETFKEEVDRLNVQLKELRDWNDFLQSRNNSYQEKIDGLNSLLFETKREKDEMVKLICNDVSTREIMHKLDFFAQRFPGRPISPKFYEIVEEMRLAGKLESVDSGALSMPAKAPALWAKQRSGEDTPATFIQRHYGKWLNSGLHRGHIKQLDPTLYMAFYRWEQNSDRVIPPGFSLPGRAEIVAAADAKMTEGELKHAQRVVSRRQRQRVKQRESDL